MSNHSNRFQIVNNFLVDTEGEGIPDLPELTNPLSLWRDTLNQLDEAWLDSERELSEARHTIQNLSDANAAYRRQISKMAFELYDLEKTIKLPEGVMAQHQLALAPLLQRMRQSQSAGAMTHLSEKEALSLLSYINALEQELVLAKGGQDAHYSSDAGHYSGGSQENAG